MRLADIAKDVTGLNTWSHAEKIKFFAWGSVLKVEMAVSSKGLALNKTSVYGRLGVTYLHI